MTAASYGYGTPESASSSTDGAASVPSSVGEMIDAEIQKYKTLGRSWKGDRRDRTLERQNAIQWWCRWGANEFPCLMRVALAVFRLLPGSGALECDIGAFKDVIPPKRSRLEPGAVEMHLVVAKNKDLAELDPAKLGALPKKGWQRLFPTRPLSPVGYHEGEELELEPYDDNIDLGLSYDFDPN
jgi:hypothetical protein